MINLKLIDLRIDTDEAYHQRLWERPGFSLFICSGPAFGEHINQIDYVPALPEDKMYRATVGIARVVDLHRHELVCLIIEPDKVTDTPKYAVVDGMLAIFVPGTWRTDGPSSRAY